MTPAQRELWFAIAEQWMLVAAEATNAASTMQDGGLPIERCDEARAIARRCLELAAQLHELARDAAPMPTHTRRTS